MSTLTLANVFPLPTRARTPVLLAPDVHGSFARERSARRPITSGSGRSIEAAILSLLESDREREAGPLAHAEAA